jgi:hypothetical protein
MLTYRSEAWTVCKQHKSRITVAEIKFMRIAGYAHLDYERNSDILKELNTQPTMEFIEPYRYN